MKFFPEKLAKDFPLKVIHHGSLSSTNAFLKQEIQAGRLSDPVFCIAEQQTAGYGQHGRNWLSDHEALTISFAFPLVIPLDELLYRSVPPALIIRELLEEYSDQALSVKWPNDIYSGQNKVAGCLLELVTNQVTGERHIVFGLGVNLDANYTNMEFNYGYLTHLEVYGFISELSRQLLEFFLSKASINPDVWLLDWQKHDYFYDGQSVIVYDSGHSKSGIYRGLNERFEPQVLIDGSLVTFNTGQVSIRSM